MLKKYDKKNLFLILFFIQTIFLFTADPVFAVVSIQLDRQYYSTGSTVVINVTDATANKNASVEETINVNVKSAADNIGITVDLVETGESTSFFAGTFSLVETASDNGTDKLQVSNGNIITVTYNQLNTVTAIVDDDPPVLSSHDPARDAMGVSPAITTISVTFNEPIQWSINSGDISIVEYDYYLNQVNIVSKAISGDNNTTLLITISSDSLAWSKTYTVTIPAGAIEDRAGNPNSTVNWNFTTVSVKLDKSVYKPGNTVEVTVYDLAKGSGTIIVKAESNNYSSDPIFVNLSGSGGVFTGSFTLSGPAGSSNDSIDVLGVTGFYDSFSVSCDPDNDSIYEVNVSANVDGQPPTVSATSPPDGDVDVAVDEPVIITFDQDIKEGSQFGFIDIGYNDGSDWVPAGGIKRSIDGKILTINHADLANETEYWVVIYEDGVQDLLGNPYKSEYDSVVLKFTTQAVPTRNIYVAPDGDDTTIDGSQTTPYQTIGKAVDDAIDGDTILVNNGTYNESVAVTKDVTIRSVNGPGVTTIQAAGNDGFAIQPVSGSYETRRITGFTITSAGQGISVSGMSRGLVYLENNIVSGCYDGIHIDSLTGGTVYIRKNTISSNTGTGIKLETSADGNKVKVNWNNILLNTGAGIVHNGTNRLDASLNYWGNAHGPTHDGVSYGNSVSGDIDFQPWLVKKFTGTEVNTKLAVTTPTLSDAYSGQEYFNNLPVQSYTTSTNVQWSLYSGFIPDGLNIVGGKALYGQPTTMGSYSFTMEAGDGTQAVYKDVSINVDGTYTGTGPAVISRSPAPYKTDASVNAPVKIIFNEAVQLAGNNAGYVNIINTADLYDIPTINRSIETTGIADDTLVIDHFNFRPDTLYKVSVTNNVVTDMDGNSFNTEWYFTTSSQVPALDIITTSMHDGTEGTSYSLTLEASGGVGSYIWSLTSGSGLPDGLSLSSAGIISGTPTTSGSYSFTIQVTDQAGTIDTQQLAVTIQPPPDTTPPDVVQKTPGENETGVLLNAVVNVKFNESIQAGDSFADISITPQGGNAVTGGGSIDGNALTINHADFAGNTVYIVTIPAGAVKDIAGNAISVETSWSFKTGEAPDLTAPSVTITQPADSGLFNGPVTIKGSIYEKSLKGVEVAIRSVNTNKYWDGANSTWISSETWNAASYSGYAPDYSFQYMAPGKTQNATEGAYIAGVRAYDYSGNLSSTASVNYTLDLTQPEISNLSLVAASNGGFYGVLVDAPITMTFNEDVTAGDLTKIIFQNGDDVAVTFQAVIDEETNTLTITHEDLNYETYYEVIIQEGVVKDLDGNNNVNKLIGFYTEIVTASPEISSSSPVPDAHGVLVDAPITITFNKDVTVGDLTKIIFQNGDDVAVTFQAVIDEETNTLTITHEDLNNETYYEVIIQEGVVKDLDGNNNVNKLIGFYTEIVTASPEISSSSPVPDAHGVLVDAPITITFNEDVTAGDLTKIIFQNGDDVAVTFQAVLDEETNTLTITHEDLNYETYYEVIIQEGVVKDLDGNNNVNKLIGFYTEIVTASPEISSSNPVSDAHGVLVDAPITITFNEDVTVGDLTKIIFQNGDDVAVTFQAVLDEETNTLTITHEDLNYETYYEVIIQEGVVKDLDGNNNVNKLIGFYTAEESGGTVTAGDIDDSKTIDLADAILALKVVADMNPIGIHTDADVNGDGKIGLEEVVYILQKTAAP